MQRIIVLGKNYGTVLGAVRGLAELDYEIYVYYITWRHGEGDIVRQSKYVTGFTEHIGRNTDEIIKELIRLYSEKSSKALLLATDDFSASTIDVNYCTLSQYFLLPHTEQKRNGDIVGIMDKSLQVRIAQEFGLLTANSWVIKFEGAEYSLPEGISYPCFFKPLISFNGGKNGMKKCDSEDDLINELNKIKHRNLNFSVLVQEYLDISDEYSISGVALGEYSYLPALLRKIRVSKAHKGTTVYGVIESFDNQTEVYTKLQRLIKSLSLYCIVDIEIFKCGENFYFNEINFRTSAVCYAVIAGGANVLGAFADEMFNGKTDIQSDHISFGKKFLCEKAAWEDYIAGYITKEELDKMYEESDIYMIRSKEDDKPNQRFIKRMLLEKKMHRLKRIVKRILHR